MAEFINETAEQSVICTLLERGGDITGYIAQLAEEDFGVGDNAELFRAIKATALKGSGVDLVTVDETIKELYPSKCGYLTERLIETIGRSYSVSLMEQYIGIVKELSQRRKTIRNLQQTLTELSDPSKDYAEIIDKMRLDVKNVGEGKHEWVNMSDLLISTYTYLEARAKGEDKSITTGIDSIDDTIGGFYGGELTVIGARPAVGKSAFGANIALAAAKQGFKVAICSREMTDIQYGQRILSRTAFIDGMKLRKAQLEDEDWANIAECLNDIGNLPISFMFTVQTIEDLRREAMAKHDKGELDMLIVDYLQLMKTTQKFDGEHLRIGHISKMLKDIAVDLNIPVIALAQVNRDSDGQMPTLKSLKASGDIEQDADNVIFLHKPMYETDGYVDPRDKQYFNSYKDKGLAYIVIGVAKQRQGATGVACTLFDSAHMRYQSIERKEH